MFLQTAAKAKLRDRLGDFFKSDFFEMEAEMSDDEGHSDDGDDSDANADGMLVRSCHSLPGTILDVFI